MISTNFLLVPSISSPKPLTWLLAARSQFLGFGRPLDLIINEIDLCVTNLMIRKCQKHSQKWKIYSFKFMYIHKKRLDLFHQKSQPRSSYFWRVLGSKTINADPALKSWNSNRQRILQSDTLDSTRFSNSLFFLDTVVSFLFKVSIFSFLTLLHYSNKKCYFSSIQWKSEWPELT